MKKHNGMRPLDIVVLMQIAVRKKDPWFMKDIAQAIGMSASEVSESLNRSAIAGLISGDKKQILVSNLIDFLQYGIRYVFPAILGPVLRGIPTAYSAPNLGNDITNKEPIVWPFALGTERGQSIEPLHSSVPKACLENPKFYDLMALVEALRLGRAREKSYTLAILREHFCEEQ